MKRRNTTILCTALMALALPASAADNMSQGNSQYNNNNRNNSTTASDNNRLGTMQHSGMNSQQAGSSRNLSLEKLMDADARSQDGQDLGEVEDVLIDPQSGKVQFVILGQGGVLGIGEDRVPVPWQAVDVTSQGDITINQTKAKLKSAPSVKKDYSEFNQPGYTVTLYRFYAIPIGTGASESPSGTQQGQNNGSMDNQNDRYDSSDRSSQWNTGSQTNSTDRFQNR